jgi:acyl transferase domain-containing protein
VIPANAGFATPNPAIDFAHSPFRVADENIAWPRTSKPRVAGVSSFGVGGTNAHVILAEPPARPSSGGSRSKQLFLLSAKSTASLDAMTANLRDWLEAIRCITCRCRLHTANGASSFKHRR